MTVVSRKHSRNSKCPRATCRCDTASLEHSHWAHAPLVLGLLSPQPTGHMPTEATAHGHVPTEPTAHGACALRPWAHCLEAPGSLVHYAHVTPSDRKVLEYSEAAMLFFKKPGSFSINYRPGHSF